MILAGTLFVFAFLAAVFQICDHDVGYHLKTGEWIDVHHRLPDSDPFSFTRAGAPWPLQQGVPAWIFYRAYHAGGVPGLILFKALLVALVYGIVFAISLRESRSPTLAAAATMLGVLAGRYRFYERPILFSALGLAALWGCLLAWRRRPRPAPLVAAVAILFVWANLHAGWVDGMVTLGAFAAAVSFARVFHRWGRRAGKQRRSAHVRYWRAPWIAFGAALALSIGSLALLNPSGPRVLLIPFTMLRSRWFQTHVAEFRPLPHDNFIVVWVLLLLTAGAIAFAWARDRARSSDAVVFGVFAWGTLMVNRQMLLLSILAPSILASHTGAALRGIIPERWGHRAKTAVTAALMITMALIVWLGFIRGDRFLFGFGVDGRTNPVGALRFIEANHLPGEIWNEDAWGGYFLWRFWPHRRDFIDNRLDVFDERFFLDVYAPVRAGRRDWEEILDRYRVQTLLMEFTEKPIGIQELAFRSPHWALVYWDDLSLVYVRVSPDTAALVRRFGYRVVNPNSLLASLSDRAKLPEATREMERAVTTTPRSWRALNGLGVAYGMTGRYREAAFLFRRALELSPRFEGARANLRTAERHLEGGGGSSRATESREGS